MVLGPLEIDVPPWAQDWVFTLFVPALFLLAIAVTLMLAIVVLRLSPILRAEWVAWCLEFRPVPSRYREGSRMAFAFRLEHADGTPPDPPTFRTAAPNWTPGDAIPLPGGRALRVVAVKDDDADQGVH